MTELSTPSPEPVATARRPSLAFLLAHPAHFIALGCGSGLAPFAPGTAGTLWAWAAFVLMQHVLTPLQLGVIIALGLPVGWWACTRTARDLGIADPSPVVWDEIIAFWLVLWLIAPAGLLAQGIAFALFRFFDAAKPGPVGWADALFKPDAAADTPRWSAAGFGIVLDDLVAAFCTLLVFALWRFWSNG